jgi:hypothetical protein
MIMRCAFVFPCALILCIGFSPSAPAQELPFQHKFEVFREKDSDVIAFVLRLEQPFLAEEFEKSNYLRLHAQDKNAFLIYPKETKFHQKHAEFYGRLRGEGKAKVRLSYEIVSETIKGARKVEVRQADLEVPIPGKAGGPRTVFEKWANEQNRHFHHLLQYYPDESFYQYVLQQSHARYGVEPPPLPKPMVPAAEVENSLYGVFTGSRAIQEVLQRQAFKSGPMTGDLIHHVSELSLPGVEGPDYRKLLADKAAKKIEPKIHGMAKFIPADQYFLHFNSMRSASEMQDLITEWGNNLLRPFTLRAVDHRFRENFEEQLCLYREPLLGLFADGVLAELAVTGSDPFFLEGTDVSLLFKVSKLEVFQKKADEWLARARKTHPGLIERDFHYRGHKVGAHYTEDRAVSCFVVQKGDIVIYSNSHRAIRALVDAATGKAPSLADALDYRYLTTLLPPSAAANAGYFYASDAFLRHLIGPQLKIAEKRRVLCFNNLVMLNNASLMYRLENGKSPSSLTDLYENKFADRDKTVCPHGGSYSWDSRQESCTCSLHNRLKYLTPNAELNVLKISQTERDEYDRYRKSYEDFWNTLFDPIAVRFTVAPVVKLEMCFLPLARNSLYQTVRGWVESKPQKIDNTVKPKSAVVSLTAMRGPKALGEFLRGLPGINEALGADPTLTDLSWLGNQLAVHFCDSEKILELDPMRFQELSIMGLKVPAMQQAMIAVALTATQVPTCFTVEVEDGDKAARLLELLTRKIPLKKEHFLTLPADFDAYRLPDYKKHAHYVFTFQVHVFKMRLHVSLVGKHLVAATRPDVLKEAIDAAQTAPAKNGQEAHVQMRLNLRALVRLADNAQLTWSEKARLACHANTITIHNLLKLYDVKMDQVPRLAEAISGVRYFCPDHGAYEYDAKLDQVLCSAHGNRLNPRQQLQLNQKSSFSQFLDSLDEIAASLRFQDEALYVNLEIARRQKK